MAHPFLLKGGKEANAPLAQGSDGRLLSRPITHGGCRCQESRGGRTTMVLVGATPEHQLHQNRHVSDVAHPFQHRVKGPGAVEAHKTAGQGPVGADVQAMCHTSVG